MSNLATRALTGAVYVAVTLGAAWAGPFTTTLLFLPVALLAASELQRLLGDQVTLPPAGAVLLAAVGLFATALGAFLPEWTWAQAIGLLFLALFVVVVRLLHRHHEHPVHGIGCGLLMVLYIGVPFGTVPHLFVHGSWLFIGFMLMLWTNDTGAYLVGRSLGRTKLLPSVSPNKTVEGFVGGVLFTLGVAWVLARQHDFLPLSHWLLLGATVAITSTVGDLLESAFKRAAGVKDSGTLLPGHGGLLDRFDGFLLAAPAAAILLHLLR